MHGSGMPGVLDARPVGCAVRVGNPPCDRCSNRQAVTNTKPNGKKGASKSYTYHTYVDRDPICHFSVAHARRCHTRV